MSVNRVVVVGNMTKDPETFSAGSKFGVAVNERVKKNDEWTDYASFFDVVCFGKLGENVAKYCHKGSKVAIDGRLRQERWESEDGKRSKVAIYAFEVQFLDPKENGNGGGPPTPQHQAGSLESTGDNVRQFCTCPPGGTADNCPIDGHGIPF